MALEHLFKGNRLLLSTPWALEQLCNSSTTARVSYGQSCLHFYNIFQSYSTELAQGTSIFPSSSYHKSHYFCYNTMSYLYLIERVVHEEHTRPLRFNISQNYSNSSQSYNIKHKIQSSNSNIS